MSALCRICHKKGGKMITPCACRGSISHAHPDCVKQWIVRTRSHSCAVCGASFVVARVLDKDAPPIEGGNDTQRVPLSRSLRVIFGHILRRWSEYAARASFVTLVWVCIVPLFLSLVWQLLFNTRWLASEINRTLLSRLVLHDPLSIRAAQQLSSTLAAQSPPPSQWWWSWYLPGVELFIFGGACVIVVASFWEWCGETIATFEDPTNFDVHQEAAVPLDFNEDDDDSEEDEKDEKDEKELPASAASAVAAEESIPADIEPTPPAPRENDTTTPDEAAPNVPIELAAPSPPPAADVRARRLHSKASSPRHPQTPLAHDAAEAPAAPQARGMSPTELNRALSTLFDGGRQRHELDIDGDARRGDTGILEHFGARGSYINAIAIAFAFGVLFVPTMLFMLGASPFMLGGHSGFAVVGIWDNVLPLVPVATSIKDYVATVVATILQALTGVPLLTMFPSFQTAGAPMTSQHNAAMMSAPSVPPRFGLWHPGAVVFAAAGSYGGLGFLTWSLGALCLGGTLRHVSRLCFRSSGTARKNGAFAAALIRSLVINLSQMVFLPALFGLILCVLTADYWTPQPISQWRGDAKEVMGAAVRLLPKHTVVMAPNGSLSMPKEDDKAHATHATPNAALPLIKALHVVHQRLTHLSHHPEAYGPHDALLLRTVDAKVWDVSLGGARCTALGDEERYDTFLLVGHEASLSEGCAHVDSRLVRYLVQPSKNFEEVLWRFRLYAVVALLHNVHLYSDLATWAPMFIAGLFTSSLLWHCVYHIRRLVHHGWLWWLFRDPVETPMIQQMIRCRHRMVPVYCLRNVMLVILADVFVVLPALWLLRQLFPNSMPMLLSWSSGSSIIDAVGANVVVFGGRFARFMALLGGNVPLEEEVLFRRLAMIAEFLRDAHEGFMERVGGDLHVATHLQDGTAPPAAKDFFFPFRIVMFGVMYLVVSIACVSAVLVPGVFMNHWLLQMFPADDSTDVELRASATQQQRSPLSDDDDHTTSQVTPLTLHAILIGWSLILISAQVYTVVAPHVRHAVLTLRYRLLHANRLRAIWAAIVVESATGGAVVLQHHSIKIALASEEQRDITSLTARVASSAGNPLHREGTGVVQWLANHDIVISRVTAARTHLLEVEEMAAESDAVMLLTDILQLVSNMMEPSFTTGRITTRTLSLNDATKLRRALTNRRIFPLREQMMSVFVYCAVFAFGCALTPLLVGSTLLRLCWSGVVRSSTQTIALSGSLPTASYREESTAINVVNYFLRHSSPLWWISWCVGALVLIALSVLWRQHFTRCARVLRDYQRVGLLQSGRLSGLGSIVMVVCGTILWMTAGISFFPVTVARWSRTLFALASGTPSPWRPDVTFLVNGYPEPSDAEMLLVHFGLLEWILVVAWNAAIALVGDHHLPFLPSNREWITGPRPAATTATTPTSPAAANLQSDTEVEYSQPNSPQLVLPQPVLLSALAEQLHRRNAEVLEENDFDVELPALTPAATSSPKPRDGVFHRARAYVERYADQYCREAYDALYLKDIEVFNHQ